VLVAVSACSTVFGVAVVAGAEMSYAINIPGDKVFPESLTSTADGTVIIGSIGTRTIFRAKPGSDIAKPWIPAGTDGMESVFGLLADEKSKTLWACSNVFPRPAGAASPPSALHAFDLKTGAAKGHYLLPTPNALCNDIAVGPDGSVYATDTGNMEIVRLRKGGSELEVWAGGGAFGPVTGAVDGISVIGDRVLVNTVSSNKLFSVPIKPDGAAGTVIEMKLDRALEHPDGMRRFGKNAVLVAESGSDGRLSRIDVDGESGKVVTLKHGYPGGPVSLTVVGTTCYVLEGQLQLLMGSADPNAKAKPFYATAVALGARPQS
jgi:hypothetical protein